MKKTSKNKKTTVQHAGHKTSAAQTDIVKLILEDHKPLKKLIKIMKNADGEFATRRFAVGEFIPLLLEHANSEAEILYTHLREDERSRSQGFGGEVEHKLAEEMAIRCTEAGNEDLLSAEIKILAELVEHHIKEEESKILPYFKRHSSAMERSEMGLRYVDCKRRFDERTPSRDGTWIETETQMSLDS